MGRDGGPERGTDAWAGALRSSRPRAPRPPVGLGRAPAGRRHPLGARRSPKARRTLRCRLRGRRWARAAKGMSDRKASKTESENDKLNPRGGGGGRAEEGAEPRGGRRGAPLAFSPGRGAAGGGRHVHLRRRRRPQGLGLRARSWAASSAHRRPPARRSARPGPPGLSRKSVQGPASPRTPGGSRGKGW